MPSFTPSQQRVLSLDPGRHASVIGAPGSGKTTLLVESFARVAGVPNWAREQLLILAPDRLAAARLRARLEQRFGEPLGGTPVRTPASFAFAVLARAQASAGEAAPRLLTGTAHDEVLSRVIESWRHQNLDASWAPAPEVLASQRFRAELREFTRVLDDHGLEAPELFRQLANARAAGATNAFSRAPETGLAERWEGALGIVERARLVLASERPGEVSSSGLLAHAAALLREQGASAASPVPRLLLIDDAQDFGEGELALIAACAGLGSSIWVFGDPDLATGSFAGERAELITALASELERRGGRAALTRTSAAGEPDEAVQHLQLDEVHRHGFEIRGLVQQLTSRVGAAGAGSQRSAPVAHGSVDIETDAVQFTRASSAAEQLGILAHRLRARHLGVGGAAPLPWSEMAVICRSRSEANRAARLLAAQQIPTGITAGGLVLREHGVVRELVLLLKYALGIAVLDAADVLQLLRGVIGGLDAVAVRRLRGALLVEERRRAAAAEIDPVPVLDLIGEAFAFPGDRPIIDSAGGRALRRLGLLAAAGRRVHEAGGTAREVLWQLWDGTGLATRWQEEALSDQGVRSAAADRALDAVMGLFFHLQRHEEQASEQAIDEVLEDLLLSDVPEDTLAARAVRDAVVVTTPQGLIGREFTLVGLLGPQDGVWPNLRAQGSLLGVPALERWLRGGAAEQSSRRDTLHDELRLMVLACSRARAELLVVAIADDEQHPSPFFGFGREFEVAGLPSSRLTLRGAVGEMRRRLEHDDNDTMALHSLAALASEHVPGAHPDDWYGVRPPSTVAPLVDLDGDPDARVRLSPSHIEKAEKCPLDWAIGHLGGSESTVNANLGTLMHRAFELAGAWSTIPSSHELLEIVEQEWGKLPFEAEWEAERTRRLAGVMAEGIVAYLSEFQASNRMLLGNEAPFTVELGRALISGKADRIEATEPVEGGVLATILDLKTGGSAPSRGELEDHAQLRAYQLGLELGGFALQGLASGDLAVQNSMKAPSNGGARLLYVHPKSVRRNESFSEFAQEASTAEQREVFVERVRAAAEVMAAGRFAARVEHHCLGGHFSGQCKIHVIPPVSHA